jgi:hypothetical protein
MLDQEGERGGFAGQVEDKLTDLTFEHKRRILELIRPRVDVLGQTKVKLAGAISSEGLSLDLESLWQCGWVGRTGAHQVHCACRRRP